MAQKTSLSIFLKGLFMGICDLVPGISGGTIAFITGIYSRLIHAVKGVLHPNVLFRIIIVSFITLIYPIKDHRKRFDRVYTSYDLYFLFTLLAGILIAIFVGSRVMVYLLDYYFVLVMMFFIGLIFASSFVIYRSIHDSKVTSKAFSLIGFFVGASLIFLVPATIQMNPLYVFVSGFIGIFAMFLPGISGSYLLYILGSYELILSSVSSLDWDILFIFVLGCILGAVCISHVVSFLLKKYYSSTLYFLFGFVLGALLIPIRDVLLVGFNGYDLYFGVVLFFVGVFLVVIMGRLRSSTQMYMS